MWLTGFDKPWASPRIIFDCSQKSWTPPSVVPKTKTKNKERKIKIKKRDGGLKIYPRRMSCLGSWGAGSGHRLCSIGNPQAHIWNLAKEPVAQGILLAGLVLNARSQGLWSGGVGAAPFSVVMFQVQEHKSITGPPQKKLFHHHIAPPCPAVRNLKMDFSPNMHLLNHFYSGFGITPGLLRVRCWGSKPHPTSDAFSLGTSS